jgi:hypothetical protein
MVRASAKCEFEFLLTSNTQKDIIFQSQVNCLNIHRSSQAGHMGAKVTGQCYICDYVDILTPRLLHL